MSAENNLKIKEEFQIDFHGELAVLLEFIKKRPNCGRFVRTFLNQIKKFDERLEKEFNLSSKRDEPLLSDCFKLLLLEFALDDKRISNHFEIPLADARNLMDTLHFRFPTFFELRPDNEFGWKIITTKEATFYGIK